MRYIIYGAGAVGGVTGARLFEGGHEVVLIARGAHLDAIRQRGLVVHTPHGERTLPIPAVGRPAEIGFRDDDIVILAMKTQDTESALVELESAAGSDVTIFCAQNGVENERLALRRFERVYGVFVIMPATHFEPGVVEQEAAPLAGILDAGRPDGGIDETVRAVARDLEASGISSIPRLDVMRWKYAKLLSNLNNALQAICGLEADTKDLRREVTEEGKAVLRAAGIDFAPEQELSERRKGKVEFRGGTQGSSSWQSIVRGAGSIETDYLNGEIVLLGRQHGVPAPLNEAVRQLANRAARERLRPGSAAPDEVRKLAALLAGG